MASMSINFPDDQQSRVRNALCDYGGYQPKLEDGTDNPVSRAEFARGVVRGFIRDVVRQQERDAARRQADALPDPGLT